jgi:hypothetical protein
VNFFLFVSGLLAVSSEGEVIVPGVCYPWKGSRHPERVGSGCKMVMRYFPPSLIMYMCAVSVLDSLSNGACHLISLP